MAKLFSFFIVILFLFSSLANTQDLRKEVQNIQKKKIELILEQKRLLKELAALEKKLHNLSRTQEKKKQHTAQNQEEIAKKLPFLVRLGRANPLRLLVDTSAEKEVLRGIALVRAFTLSLKQQILKNQTELKEIASLANELNTKTQTHQKLIDDIESKQAQLSNLEIQKLEEFKKEEINHLAKETDINTLLDESRTTLSPTKRKAAGASSSKGLPFRWLERPVTGKIIANPSLQKKFSPTGNGIIFEAKKNAEVFAPSQGKVVFKGPFRNQGDILILEHGKKVYTILMGIHKIDAQVGQTVYAGEKLGTMAGYGATPPQLYFELRQKGKAIDPTPYFANQ